MVPLAGIEPALLAELDFESSASTSSATGALGPWQAAVTKRAEYSWRARAVNPQPAADRKHCTGKYPQLCNRRAANTRL